MISLLGLIPAERAVGGLLFPPVLVVCILGLFVTLLFTRALNRARLNRYFWNLPLAFMAMWAFFSAVIGLVFIAP